MAMAEEEDLCSSQGSAADMFTASDTGAGSMDITLATRPQTEGCGDDDDWNDDEIMASQEMDRMLEDVEGSQAADRPISLTDQQKAICQAAADNNAPVEEIIQICAGAGTGKTFTLLQALKHMTGHRAVVFTCFGKADAEALRRRITDDVPDDLDVRSMTINSMANKILQTQGRVRRQFGPLFNFLPDDLKADILGTLHAANDTRESRSVESNALRLMKDIMSLYQRSALGAWSTLSPNDINGMLSRSKVYSKILQSWRAERKSSNILSRARGPELHELLLQWCTAWWNIEIGQRDSYESQLKRVQLEQARLRWEGFEPTALFIDEGQDLTECQSDWLLRQRYHGIKVIIAGDSFQGIYEFRGCNPRTFSSIEAPVNRLPLTATHRFGPDLCSVANCVLFGLDNHATSVQSMSYRLTPSGSLATTRSTIGTMPDTDQLIINPRSMVQTIRVIDNWIQRTRSQHSAGVTIIGRSNAMLVMIAFGLSMLGVDYNINSAGTADQFRKLQTTVRQLLEVKARLIANPIARAISMPAVRNLFNRNDRVTWSEAVKAIEEADHLQDMRASLVLVEAWGDGADTHLDQLREVMHFDKIEPEGGLLLTTVHKAKGREWEAVGLCNDMCELLKVNTQAGIFDWQILEEFRIWYVAVTRAKQSLFVPLHFRQWMHWLRTPAAEQPVERLRQRMLADIGEALPNMLLGPAPVVPPENALGDDNLCILLLVSSPETADQDVIEVIEIDE